MKKRILGILIILTAIGCTKQAEENKSMEEIHRENGVPVKVRIIESEPFTQVIRYFSTVTGIEEISVMAGVADDVEAVHVTVGDQVNKGDLLISFPENNLKANYRQAEAAYNNASSSFLRMEILYSQGGISQQEFDNIRTQLDVARATWESVSQLIHVKAPISGMVTNVNVQATDNVEVNQELLKISKIERMKTRFHVNETEVSLIKTGQRIVAVSGAERAIGKVTQVGLSMDKKTQSFGIVAEFDNRKNILRSGVTVDLELEVYQNPAAIIVNLNELQNFNDKYYAYIARDNQAVRIPVKIGKQSGATVEVVEGLSTNDRLIVEGHLLLEPDVKINIHQ